MAFLKDSYSPKLHQALCRRNKSVVRKGMQKLRARFEGLGAIFGAGKRVVRPSARGLPVQASADLDNSKAPVEGLQDLSQLPVERLQQCLLAAVADPDPKEPPEESGRTSLKKQSPLANALQVKLNLSRAAQWLNGANPL